MTGNWLTTDEAAHLLGVRPQSLYAYASRGLLRPRRIPGERGSQYRRMEVERLALQRSRTRKPQQVARATLDWGLPVLASSLTLIREGSLYYRGQDAMKLAQHSRLEEIAALLWDCPVEQVDSAPAPQFPAGWRARLRAAGDRPLPERCPTAFAMLHDDRTDAQVIGECATLLRTMISATTGQAASAEPVHLQFQRIWQVPAGRADDLRAALVVCADHELNASSFTARCVASTGASLAAVVLSGLAALSGRLHGGITRRVEAMWDRVERSRSPGATLRTEVRRLMHAAQRLDRPTRSVDLLLPGFGHTLYPDGDPRAALLLERLPPDKRRQRFIESVEDLSGLRPALDFALVAMRRSLGLPLDSAYALFATGRSVGWLGHALEQRAAAQLIRPRAAYVGLQPESPDLATAPVGRVIRQR